MTDWIVPIGQPLGINSYSEDFAVRTGGVIEELDEFTLLAWASLVGKFEDPPQWMLWDVADERLRRALEMAQPHLGTPPIADCFEHLIERDLAKRVARSAASVQQFCATHRFQPGLVGLWVSPTERERRFVGFDEDVVLSLGSDAYEVYVESAAHPTLRDACMAVAMRADPSTPEEYAERVERVRDAFVETARAIVVVGGGWFDRVVSS